MPRLSAQAASGRPVEQHQKTIEWLSQKLPEAVAPPRQTVTKKRTDFRSRWRMDFAWARQPQRLGFVVELLGSFGQIRMALYDCLGNYSSS